MKSFDDNNKYTEEDMRVNSIRNNIAFGARLNVLGKFFVAEEYNTLLKKADKIGFENDIIELNYINYKDRSIEFLNQKQPDFLKKISCSLRARFIPNGEGNETELYKETVSADNYKEFWNKENSVANKYLDKLVEKYPNERIGVSIIEN